MIRIKGKNRFTISGLTRNELDYITSATFYVGASVDYGSAGRRGTVYGQLLQAGGLHTLHAEDTDSIGPDQIQLA